jgi:hypothetical protein
LQQHSNISANRDRSIRESNLVGYPSLRCLAPIRRAAAIRATDGGATLASVAEWQPLSRRSDPDALAALAAPVEGIPPWTVQPIKYWVEKAVRNGYSGEIRLSGMQDFQLRYRLASPLPLSDPLAALATVVEWVGKYPDLALDFIDYVLHHASVFQVPQHQRTADTMAAELDVILKTAGSVWEVVPTDDDGYQLARRAVGPVRAAVADLPPDTRAAQHLTTAWNRLSGREPDASLAYREAIRAVEAAAKPVLTPNDERATLGKMIAAIKNKPDKWTVTLGSVDGIRLLMESVWQGQLDRHGTNDERVPLNVSSAHADAAVTTCITLVRLFVGGHVHRTGDG